MPLDLAMVKKLPRKVKRRIWIKCWKYKRREIGGYFRQEKRNNWRKIWDVLRSPN